MKIVTGKVVDGKIEVEGRPLMEGSKVGVLVPDSDDTFRLSPEDEAELLESLAEADRGEVRPMGDFFRELDQRK